MQVNSKKLVLSFLLSLILVLGLATAAPAQDFADLPDNWATEALQNAVDQGYLSGNGGYLYPDNLLTRAEMVSILNRILDNQELADLATYTDADSSKWYYEDLAKAVAAGILQGSDSQLRPEDPVTRQEAFVVLAKSFELNSSGDLSSFNDAEQVADWAKGSAEALVMAGYLQGSNNQLNPLATITRAEFVQLLYNIQKPAGEPNVETAPNTPSTTPASGEPAKATVMVYLIGADLESGGMAASGDLTEMLKSQFGDKVKVIVQLGGADRWWLLLNQDGSLANVNMEDRLNAYIEQQSAILDGIEDEDEIAELVGIDPTVTDINDLDEMEIWEALFNFILPNEEKWKELNSEYQVINPEAQVQRYQIANGKMIWLEDLGQKNMSTPESLSDFVTYGVTNYPAERYGIVLWDHGGGTIGGYGVDEKNGDGTTISLTGLRQAFDTAYQATGQKLDFINFDACLMATAETALALKDNANYLIASEEYEPGFGQYYTNWLNQLSVTPDISTAELGKVMVDDYIRQSLVEDEASGKVTTLSVYDLSKSDQLYQAMTDFYSQSADYFVNSEGGATDLLTARSQSFGYAMDMVEQIDIIDYLNHLEVPELADNKAKLQKAVQDMVYYSKTGADMVDNSFGMAMYYPYYALEAYEPTMKVLDELNISGMYKTYYADMANLIAGMEIESGSNPLYSIVGYSGEELGYDWYDPNFELNYDLPTENHALLQFTDKDGKKVLHLDNWDNIIGAEMQILVDMGETFEPRYIDLGTNNSMNFDQDGDLIVDYDGNWLSFNELTVPFYLLDNKDGVKYGYVPCIINGNEDYDSQLLVYWDQEHPKGYVAGYRNVINDTISKGIFPLTKGDNIQFLVDGYDNNGDFLDYYLYGDPLIYDGNNLEPAWDTIGHFRCSVVYMLTDVFQNHYWTEVINFDS